MKPSSWRYQPDRIWHGWRRYRLRERVLSTCDDILSGWDQPAFRRRFAPFWDPFADTAAAKFLDVHTWLREAAFRYYLTLPTDPDRPRRVLDLGAGTGYYLLVCRHAGHDVLALDVPGEALYDACMEFFAIPRIPHRIEPQVPLPDVGQPLDLITAFMTCFNWDEQLRPWGVESWQFFLEDVRARLARGGRVVIKFNVNPVDGRFYSPDVARLFRRQRGFRTRFFFDYAVLDTIE